MSFDPQNAGYGLRKLARELSSSPDTEGDAAFLRTVADFLTGETAKGQGPAPKGNISMYAHAVIHCGGHSDCTATLGLTESRVSPYLAVGTDFQARAHQAGWSRASYNGAWNYTDSTFNSSECWRCPSCLEPRKPKEDP